MGRHLFMNQIFKIFTFYEDESAIKIFLGKNRYVYSQNKYKNGQ